MTEIKFSPFAGQVRAMGNDEVKKLLVLGAPYGGHKADNRDEWGEYFSERTDFMLELGESRPSLYFHGFDPDGYREKSPPILGRALATMRDDMGLWFEVVLNKATKYAERIWKAAIQGTARASTGAVGHLTRTSGDGEVLMWPIGELSLIDAGDGRQPVNQLATAIPLKALYEGTGIELPKAFTETGETVKVIAGGKVHELSAEQIKGHSNG